MKRQQAQVDEIAIAMPMTRDRVSDIRNIIVLTRRSVVRHINTMKAQACRLKEVAGLEAAWCAKQNLAELVE